LKDRRAGRGEFVNRQVSLKRNDRKHFSNVNVAPRSSNGDASLVAEAKSGSSLAFGELYERHRTRTYRAAFRVLRNQEDAEDAVQRCFQRVLTNLSRFREESAFSTWVTRIAINEALMLLRQRRTIMPLQENNYGDAESVSEIAYTDRGPTPEQTLAENELRAIVMHAISQLREKLRVVIFLREFQGLTSAETALRLGLTVAAVKARTFHARRYLQQQIGRKYKHTLSNFLIGTRNTKSRDGCQSLHCGHVSNPHNA
jgi:RNA polymerase sigma-70 factor (ECF subfamily)